MLVWLIKKQFNEELCNALGPLASLPAYLGPLASLPAYRQRWRRKTIGVPGQLRNSYQYQP